VAKLTPNPLTIRIETKAGRLVQQLRPDAQTGVLSFLLGEQPVLGFGEGGPQFDRRGATYTNRNGQGGYQLRTHGGRVPIQWLIGTAGWAMYIHHPLGAFDLSGKEGRLTPRSVDTPANMVAGALEGSAAGALPLDVLCYSGPCRSGSCLRR
jgi:alpha-glucosidase/alpha-D-xyloside xylohydrolase